MASTAEGQHDGVTTAGPDNKFDGVSAHPEVDGCSDLPFPGALRITQPWQTGQSASPSPNFALGNVPD